MLSSPLTMANCSSLESTPILRSIVAWAMEPRMSWRHGRQSNEMDSVNRATSAPGSPRNLPLRESGELFFMPLFAPESLRNRPESHAGKADRRLSTPFHKYDHVCCVDFRFWRGATREHPPKWGCDRGATKPEPKSDATLRAAVLFVPDVVAHSLQTPEGYARRSRLVWAKNPSPQTWLYL